MEMVMAQRSMTIHRENRTPWQDVTSICDKIERKFGLCRPSGFVVSRRSEAVLLTLLWKLKTVTERHTRAVIPRHSTTDLVL